MKVIFTTPLEENSRKLFERDNLNIVYKNKKDVTAEDLKDTEIVFGNVSPDLCNTSDTLKWVQLDSAGTDGYEKLKDSILLTNASGAYSTAISEHMLACTLAVIKNLYRYRDQQEFHNWTNLGSVKTIGQLTVLSVGMGSIGSAYAQIMHSLGAKVYGIRRTIHDKPDYLEGLYTTDQIDEILPQCDIVAMSLPGTEETAGLMDYDRLHHMKKGSVLINVGRGSAIVEKDLIRVMKENYLSAACLDVTEHEPLPKNNPLWETEHVYITPHISGRFNAEVTYDLVLEIFRKNLDHYLKKEPLEHLVDRKRGY